MKPIAIAAIVALVGCEPGGERTADPVLTGGRVIGAVERISGAILATCRTLDGQTVRVAVDGLAATAGAREGLAGLRAARQGACATVDAVHVIGEELGRGAPAPTVHAPAPGRPRPEE